MADLMAEEGKEAQVEREERYNEEPSWCRQARPAGLPAKTSLGISIAALMERRL